MSSAEPAIVLVGPMGAGKTSIGRRVARALGTTFTDTDKLIVRDHGPIPELFREHGEPRFRLIERDAVAEALERGGVVALGGGAVMDAQTRERLAAHRVVLLTVAPHIVASRVLGTPRPLLAGEDPIAEWKRIYAERLPVYRAVADLTLDTSSGRLSEIVTRIAEWARSEESTEEDR
ncbi:shikimate kinase [Microbacterium sp. ASV81]|uniref:Shikimate kinase n=1 Tax=Microbacterium capsulatum TaxID=3041921 RepID=A0ABU0XCT7_9MICO|nr:shikimate kinase [Microbacterium sp. ASV81]MDQ4212767.1 shikimate kinase [Microbacterium sp. ASV81]